MVGVPPEQREEVILSLAGLVIGTARSMALARSLPDERVEEMISAGWAAAIAAVDRWDEARCPFLHVFVSHRVRGEMIDELRRGGGYRVYGYDEQGEPILTPTRPPTVSWDALEAAYGFDRADPDDPYAEVEAKLTVAQILPAVRQPHRSVLVERYLHETPVAEMSARRRVHKTRASQLIRAALISARLAIA